jgi:signal transduction histidine kinase
LSHVADTISISADPGLDDLHVTLNKVSQHVGSVINQLHDRQRELLKADQLAAIGQLAAGLAHELRNPLMCMTVLVQSAISDRSRKLDDQDMQVLNDEMSRLDRLLQEFLDFARPRRIQPQAVDLGASVKQTLSVLIPKAERVSVEIEAKIPDEPVFAFADPDQLRQLTLNLVLNSIHAISRDGRVEVSVIANDEASGFCALEVADTGPGLTDEQMARLFEPFFSTKDFGLGMGLPICQRIVEAHGGEIFAGNGPLGGAVFKVRLPIAQQMDAAESHVESAVAPPALTGDRG